MDHSRPRTPAEPNISKPSHRRAFPLLSPYRPTPLGQDDPSTGHDCRRHLQKPRRSRTRAPVDIASPAQESAKTCTPTCGWWSPATTLEHQPRISIQQIRNLENFLSVTPVEGTWKIVILGRRRNTRRRTAGIRQRATQDPRGTAGPRPHYPAHHPPRSRASPPYGQDATCLHYTPCRARN